ncbi:MAG: mechanosensitive ion channel domain-containing protein [Pirellulales bacterium]
MSPIEESRPATSHVPQKVEIRPAARDSEIQERLHEILSATGWFIEPKVTVKNGVAFVDGRTADESHQQWAGDLVAKTEGVVAVVNRIEVATPSPWDFRPAREGIDSLMRAVVRALPIFGIAVFVLSAAWAVALLIAHLLRRVLRRKVSSHLLREVAARAIGLLIFLLGLYFVFQIAGLTRLAVTVVGGTGLMGLILGIAFRDITENFLASLFLSLQRPFREGDLIEIAGTMGIVERLTSRTTVLVTLDGNQVQIPNATVFKSSIRNFSSNPNRREDFTIGIGYDDVISQAQEIVLKVLLEHPAVLKDPEAWVLVDNLGAATVNLRVYFWLDGTSHSWLKVRSSVIRLVKRALQDANISLPDSAREVIFPQGVPLWEANGHSANLTGTNRVRSSCGSESEEVSTGAEAQLQSDAATIKEQARKSWSPDSGENLLAN